MMFAAMQTSLVFSMDERQAAHQAIVAYAPFAQAERAAFDVLVDSSNAEFSQAQMRYELCKAQECKAREELLRQYPQYVFYNGQVVVNVDGGYAVTTTRVDKYVKSQNKRRPFQLAALGEIE